MSALCYQTLAFDGASFAIELGPTGTRLGGCVEHEAVEAVCEALVSSFVDEPDIKELDDGYDLGSERLDSQTEYWVGLVDHVRHELLADQGGDQAELSRLLGCISEVDGRLVDHGLGVSSDAGCGKDCDIACSFIGFLVPDEVRRAGELLGGVVLTDPYREDDRQLLLRLLTIVSMKGLGLFRLWFS